MSLIGRERKEDLSVAFCKLDRDGPILTITMDKQERLNAMNAPDAREMSRIFDDYLGDSSLRVCILTGAGERAFCAGHDMLDHVEEPMPATGFGGLTERRDIAKPIIAAINGFALGGGLSLALACDIVLASENAELGLVQGRVGGADYCGGPSRLGRQIPYRHAMAMALTGRRFKAAETLSWGLINEVVPPGELMASARRWADEIVACAPLSVRVHKQLVRMSAEGVEFVDSFASQHPRLIEEQFRSPDTYEGITAFAEKRRPVWTGK